MRVPAPEVIERPAVPEAWDAAFERAPNCPAVFLVWAHQGAPLLSRTALLRQRLKRLLGHRPQPSRALNLREVAERVDYWRTASRLESSLLFYELARAHFPQQYRAMQRLRLPPYIKVLVGNQFPRCQVTRRLAGSSSFYYGPFRSRSSAEEFQNQFLDLFQIRRCLEDLEPSPAHPGCVYGEMNMCLRPCQQVVTIQEYRSEVERVLRFLQTQGESLLESVAAARERLSEEMNFEEAARQHQHYERVRQVLKLRDELAGEAARLCGVAVTRSTAPEAVELWFLLEGGWLDPCRFSLKVEGEKIVSMDRRLREIALSLQPPKLTGREREEHLALLARWFYSSQRDGEWLAFPDLEHIPYRKLVNAIHRVGKG